MSSSISKRTRSVVMQLIAVASMLVAAAWFWRWYNAEIRLRTATSRAYELCSRSLRDDIRQGYDLDDPWGRLYRLDVLPDGSGFRVGSYGSDGRPGGSGGGADDVACFPDARHRNRSTCECRFGDSASFR